METVPVVITEGEYRKGERTFEAAAGKYAWKVAPGAEAEAARAVRESGARIAVLGVERYVGPLYEALAANAGVGKALIARYGVGYDGISLEACRRHGILLTITPGTLDRSVAEHAVALMMGAARNIPSCDAAMRDGRFSPQAGFELGGKVLGLAGIGHIGKRVAHIAARGLGMKVVAFAAHPLSFQAEREGLTEAEFLLRNSLDACGTDFRAFASACDVVSIHMPARPETDGFFDAARLAAMKRGALLVNTSRGRLVDEGALYDALASGALRAAALDVYRKEPYVPADPGKDLRRLANVILTPHVASNTAEANGNMQQSILRNIGNFLAGSHDLLDAVRLPNP